MAGIVDLTDAAYQDLKRAMLEKMNTPQPTGASTSTMPDSLAKPLSWKRSAREAFRRECRDLADGIVAGTTVVDLSKVNPERYAILRQEVIEATRRRGR